MECSICLDEIHVTGLNNLETECRHNFHVVCMKSYITSINYFDESEMRLVCCPLCRKVLDKCFVRSLIAEDLQKMIQFQIQLKKELKVLENANCVNPFTYIKNVLTGKSNKSKYVRKNNFMLQETILNEIIETNNCILKLKTVKKNVNVAYKSHKIKCSCILPKTS